MVDILIIYFKVGQIEDILISRDNPRSALISLDRGTMCPLPSGRKGINKDFFTVLAFESGGQMPLTNRWVKCFKILALWALLGNIKSHRPYTRMDPCKCCDSTRLENGNIRMGTKILFIFEDVLEIETVVYKVM